MDDRCDLLVGTIKTIEERKRVAAKLGFPLGQLLADWDGEEPCVARHLFARDDRGIPARPLHAVWDMRVQSWKPLIHGYAAWFGLGSASELRRLWFDVVNALLSCGMDARAPMDFREWVYESACKFALIEDQQVRDAQPAAAPAVVGYDPEAPGF